MRRGGVRCGTEAGGVGVGQKGSGCGQLERQDVAGWDVVGRGGILQGFGPVVAGRCEYLRGEQDCLELRESQRPDCSHVERELRERGLGDQAAGVGMRHSGDPDVWSFTHDLAALIERS